ncbi:MAG: flavin reductase family protein [Saccharofermentanales bacterium]
MEKTKIYNKKSLDAPSTFLNPVPVVMVSCCGLTEGFDKPNIITLAWTGTVNSEPPMLSISIRKSRHSHRQIMESNEFVVNLVNTSLLEACDFCGVKSGRDIDKFVACDLTKEKIEGSQTAVSIKNSPVSMYCKVTQIIELGSHDMFLGEIISIKVDENLFDRNGKINLRKADLVAYIHGEYCSLSSVLGFYGYSVAAPAVLKRRLPVKFKKDAERNKK